MRCSLLRPSRTPPATPTAAVTTGTPTLATASRTPWFPLLARSFASRRTPSPDARSPPALDAAFVRASGPDAGLVRDPDPEVLERVGVAAAWEREVVPELLERDAGPELLEPEAEPEVLG